ncbi:hypothetical protein Q3G72_008750 [Acer saccharum]|nr:hypothetical protein Q3G72_008750 [Acer saccharum]
MSLKEREGLVNDIDRSNDLVEEVRRYRQRNVASEKSNAGKRVELANEISGTGIVESGAKLGGNSNFNLGVDSGRDPKDRSKGERIVSGAPVEEVAMEVMLELNVVSSWDLGKKSSSGNGGCVPLKNNCIYGNKTKDVVNPGLDLRKGVDMEGVGKMGIIFTDEGIRPSKLSSGGLSLKGEIGPKGRKWKRAARLGQVNCIQPGSDGSECGKRDVFAVVEDFIASSKKTKNDSSTIPSILSVDRPSPARRSP